MQEQSPLDHVALLAKKACGNILKDQGDRFFDFLISERNQRPVLLIYIIL